MYILFFPGSTPKRRYTQYLASSKAEATAVAAATAVLLLLHRCIRLLGIQLKALKRGLGFRVKRCRGVGGGGGGAFLKEPTS